MTEQKFKCACGQNLKCEGECRDANLFRTNRNFLSRCPSAHNDGIDKYQKQKSKKEVYFKSQVPEFEELKSSLSVVR